MNYFTPEQTKRFLAQLQQKAKLKLASYSYISFHPEGEDMPSFVTTYPIHYDVVEDFYSTGQDLEKIVMEILIGKIADDLVKEGISYLVLIRDPYIEAVRNILKQRLEVVLTINAFLIKGEHLCQNNLLSVTTSLE